MRGHRHRSRAPAMRGHRLLSALMPTQMHCGKDDGKECVAIMMHGGETEVGCGRGGLHRGVQSKGRGGCQEACVPGHVFQVTCSR
eukprot:1854984-Rhodomonas_salina.1